MVKKIMQNEKLYDKYLSGHHWEQHPTIYAERFADFLKNRDFKNTLIDLGCGNGRDVNVFNQKGFKVIGVDISENEITKAKNNFPDCKFEKQDIQNLNFTEESIGGGFMINVAHYVDQEKTLNEIKRILKKDGYLFVHFNLSIVDKNNVTDYQQPEEKILKLFSGFKIVEKNIFKRIDYQPVEHTHTILEIIAEKI